MQFSPKNYSQLKSRLRSRYRTQLRSTLKKLDKKCETFGWLRENKNEIAEYSPLKWYFLEQVKLLAFFRSLPYDFSQKDVFSELDDEVFEKWNRSEFAQGFLKLLNRGTTVSMASAKTAQLLDQHLVALGNRHILKVPDTSRIYRAQSSLGEHQRDKKIVKMLETTLHLEGKELGLMTNSIKEMKDFSVKIEIALRVIRKYSPTSWERFIAFTETIVPINQVELVSYSHQELPGQSMINLYNRDFVDLIDDLLHENGHHHLNYYLNLGKVIEEPIENIYYSPWRRTLRPLRGIYHAYFTFFWAFKYFSDMASSKELDSIFYLFSKAEKEKIYWRAVEEYWMLEFTYQDLQWAQKKKLISPVGWDLVRSQRTQLMKLKKKISVWEKMIGSHKSELKELKVTLKRAAKKFKKS